ncbi:MAG: chitobiase/beta-hexosaminidase C-terminal domain-containing protein, partial [Treponemataceae bacterium]|nr:chitobiase/beta-hexosaminidase C-terminal domain-containing protein [Treponemataceae bacterium]
VANTESYFESTFNYWEDGDASAISDSYGVAPWTIVILKQVAACETPVITGDRYFPDSAQVAITCGTPGADIRYTLDGTTPTEGSARYTAPLTLSATTTVKARAFKAGLTASNVASETFTKGEQRLVEYTCIITTTGFDITEAGAIFWAYIHSDSSWHPATVASLGSNRFSAQFSVPSDVSVTGFNIVRFPPDTAQPGWNDTWGQTTDATKGASETDWSASWK